MVEETLQGVTRSQVTLPMWWQRHQTNRNGSHPKGVRARKVRSAGGGVGLLAISEEMLVSLNIGIWNPKSEKELLSTDGSDSVVLGEVVTGDRVWDRATEVREIPDQEGEQCGWRSWRKRKGGSGRPRAGCEVTAGLGYLGCGLLKDSWWAEDGLGWNGQLAIPWLPWVDKYPHNRSTREPGYKALGSSAILFLKNHSIGSCSKPLKPRERSDGRLRANLHTAIILIPSVLMFFVILLFTEQRAWKV